MYIGLDEEVVRSLCCPLCKDDLTQSGALFACETCGLTFPGRSVSTGDQHEELVFDFRISRPDYCKPPEMQTWENAQAAYERYHKGRLANDSLQSYLAEIDSVREVYTNEFHLAGKVLDIGGGQGRLRHYLDPDVDLYVSADPFIGAFSSMHMQPNLLRAYPCLSNPCSFIAAHAEHLPFKSGVFDWTHMRSVVDHLADPCLAFHEAYRCTRAGGRLLVGLTILAKKHELQDKAATNAAHRLFRAVSAALRRAGAGCAIGRSKDDHMFRLTHATLKDLFEKTGWRVIKEHWQKPPFQHCIYACGQKTIPDPAPGDHPPVGANPDAA